MTASTPLKPTRESSDKLDAYGHLNWVVESKDEDDDGWLACFDAVFNPVTNTIDYHVVVDGGNFVDTPEKGSILACDKAGIEYLKSLPERWNDVGVEQGLEMDSEVFQSTVGEWSAHIDSLVAQGISPEDMEEIMGQSYDHFSRFIA
jgi:hypothetical protein